MIHIYLKQKESDIMDIFCRIIKGEIPSYKIYEDNEVLVIMDVNPRSNGHLLVIPKKHYQDLFDIDQNTLNHILKVAKEMSNLLMDKLNCEGITLEQNNGISQEVKHFHLHIIPKYEKENKLEIENVFHKIVD